MPESYSAPDWARDAIFYQLFPDRWASSTKDIESEDWLLVKDPYGFHGGDLLGAAERLDYIAEMGFNAIYLNPIFDSSAYHGYHTTDYFYVNPALGGDAAFEIFLGRAHELGMKVILDGVFNHTGIEFEVFREMRQMGKQGWKHPKKDWYNVHGYPIDASLPNYSAWWGMGDLPELNTDNPEVREFIFKVGGYWLRRGIDGWRLDVPGCIEDHGFWREFRRSCKEASPDCYIVGEFWDRADGWIGDQFDGQMMYPQAYALLGFFLAGTGRIDWGHVPNTGFEGKIPILYGENGGGPCLRSELEDLTSRYPGAVQLNILDSHDTARLWTLAKGDLDSVKLLYAMQMTLPGAPCIYYGDEIGLEGSRDPDCRRPFPWNSCSSEGEELRQTLKSLIHLRRQMPAFRRGNFKVIHADHDSIAYRMSLDDVTGVAAFNRSDSNKALDPEVLNSYSLDEVLSVNNPPYQGGEVMLGPRSARLFYGS